MRRQVRRSSRRCQTRYGSRLGGRGGQAWRGGEGLSGRLHDAWGAFAASGHPGWARYTPGGWQRMIFDPAGLYTDSDPFARTRQAWADPDWQPGPWWAHGGVA